MGEKNGAWCMEFMYHKIWHFIKFLKYIPPCWLELTAPLQKAKNPTMRPPFGYAWGWNSGGRVVLDLATEWSSDFEDSILALTGLDRQLKRSNLIVRLVMSTPSIYMIILTLFLKLLKWKTGMRRWWLKVSCLK